MIDWVSLDYLMLLWDFYIIKLPKTNQLIKKLERETCFRRNIYDTDGSLVSRTITEKYEYFFQYEIFWVL